MVESMKAVAVTGEQEISIISMERPEPKENQIQIRIRNCALCTWEQRVFTGEKQVPLPLVGGHEISGEISAIGEGVDPEKYPVGSHVAARVIKACNSCYYCRRGEPTQCDELKTFWLNGPDVYGMGGLAEYICLDRSAVWCFDVEMSLDQIALTEPLACVLHSIHRAAPKMGDDAVVIGGGVMGQLHVLCLQKMGVRTILSEPIAARREFALAHGCDIVIDPSKEDAVARVKALTSGRGAESVFNTTAISSVAEDAIKMTGNLGCCVTYSSQHPDRPITISPNWMHNSEAFLTGAVNPSVVSFDQAVNVLSKGLVDIQDLITAIYPIEESENAFLEAIKPETYRVLIRL
ncbi:alcohol dehydrogenase catalytic domain-containing protein [Chloroflexota bacterium]|nr:alcohol dehydrogenase catalytic domain-containing protein [Chloroflexota bacterium]